MATRPVAGLLPSVDDAQASHHLAALHGTARGEELISLVLLSNERREAHGFTPAASLWLPDDHPARAESTQELQDTVNQRWNVYVACSAFGSIPEKGRGTRGDVSSVPGVWADLDVKPDVDGCFQSETELLTYAARLPTPTLQVASGSGGRHFYWLTHERLDADRGQELLKMWLDLLRSEARGVMIDNVQDTPRILRLAGTVRWPKVEEAGGLPAVTCIVGEGPRYHAGELELCASAAHQEQRALRDELRARRGRDETARREEVERRGLPAATYDSIMRLFNVTEDWARLLEPTGWTLHSDCRETVARCRYWTRPGKSPGDGKSASTDFVNEHGGAHVMVIYTNEPGLHDLWENAGSGESHGVCSKWHYALTRIYQGDETQLLRDVVTHQGRLPS